MKKQFYVLILSIVLSTVLMSCGSSGGGGGDETGGGDTGFPHGYIAVGNLEMQYSSNAVTWTDYGADDNLFGIAYGNGTFVVVGGNHINGEALIERSTDGGATFQWSYLTTYKNLRDVAFGSNRFVAVGDDGIAFYSSDGQTWNTATVPQAVSLRSISFDGSYFVATGYITGYVNDAWSSPDGIIWTKIGMATSGSLDGIGYANGRHIIVGFENISSGVFAPSAWYSDNRTTWTEVDMDTLTVTYFQTPSAVAYGNGYFVSVGGANAWWSDDNGVTWHHVALATSGLRNITFGGGRFVAVGQLGAVMTSMNGQQWANTSPGGGAFNDVMYW